MKSTPVLCRSRNHCLAWPDSTLTSTVVTSQWVSGARVLPTFTLLSGHSKNKTPAHRYFSHSVRNMQTDPVNLLEICCPKSPKSFSLPCYENTSSTSTTVTGEVWFWDNSSYKVLSSPLHFSIYPPLSRSLSMATKNISYFITDRLYIWYYCRFTGRFQDRHH